MNKIQYVSFGTQAVSVQKSDGSWEVREITDMQLFVFRGYKADLFELEGLDCWNLTDEEQQHLAYHSSIVV